MGMYGEDRYYEPEDGDDPEVFEAAVEAYACELIEDEYDINEPSVWGYGLSECGYDEELYPTPSHAPLEIVRKVSDHLADEAYSRATKHYENHPEALYD